MKTLLGILLLTSILSIVPDRAHGQQIQSRFFTASDGTRMHYLEAGTGTKTLAFIPGWLMPAVIFDKQIKDLSKTYRVLVLDPRSQGQSAVARGSHAPERRIKDIQEWLDAAKVSDFVLIGWSLGVLESLDFLTRHPAPGLKGLVLIDNSIGVGKPPGGGSPKFVERGLSAQVCRGAVSHPPTGRDISGCRGLSPQGPSRGSDSAVAAALPPHLLARCRVATICPCAVCRYPKVPRAGPDTQRHRRPSARAHRCL